jgi:hypothetical protein
VQRTWVIGALVLVVLAIVIAAVAVRLGDDDSGSESTAEWADAVCTSLADWRASLASLADLSGESLTAETFRDRLDEADEATSTLVTELRDLGPPDVVDGEEVDQALEDAVGGLEERYDELQSAASDALEAPSATALAGLADDFRALVEQARDIVATLQSASLFGEASAQLERAFADSASCQSLQADS